MFTGIIEATGLITSVTKAGTNRTFSIESVLASQLKIDQSIAHNGVCLTVESTENGNHVVTAVQETLSKTTLGSWEKGQIINLEQCLQWNGRLDGHVVQGHVDTTGTCINRKSLNGSWEYRIRFPSAFASLVIEKGSICLDGISLTVFNISENEFSIAIIPYTFEHTNIKSIYEGTEVNLEFDMIGKYVNRHLEFTNQ
jgi:riboflavin synthase